MSFGREYLRISSCRLWLGLCRDFIYSSVGLFILRRLWWMMIMYLEMLRQCLIFFYFVIFTAMFYWVIEDVTPWTLYLSVDLLLSIACGVWWGWIWWCWLIEEWIVFISQITTGSNNSSTYSIITTYWDFFDRLN
jgi:hypothetical protein